MKVVKISTDIYRFEDFISSSKAISAFDTYIDYLEYKEIAQTHFDYNIHLYEKWKDNGCYDTIQKLMGKELSIIQEFIEKVYNCNIELNTWGSILKLKPWNYIARHKDEHSDFQCVLHTDDIGIHNDGWELILYENSTETTLTLPTKKNSVILFPGSYFHEVLKYTWKNPRYSLAFWYSKEENIRKNKEEFNEKIDLNLGNSIYSSFIR